MSKWMADLLSYIFLYIETERRSIIANFPELQSDVGIIVLVKIFEELLWFA